MDLNQLLNLVKSELSAINHDRKHPFSLATLATKDTYPALRSVVLRAVSMDMRLLVYTDIRSRKVSQLNTDSKATLHFYDRIKKLQVVIEAETEIITAGPLYLKHKEIALKRPADYSTLLSPGTKIDKDSYKLATETHFCLLIFTPTSIDAVQLGDLLNKRAHWEWEDGWSGTWLVP